MLIIKTLVNYDVNIWISVILLKDKMVKPYKIQPLNE